MNFKRLASHALAMGLALAAAPALAGSAQATAALAGLHLQLLDLDPNDGIDPGISLTDTVTVHDWQFDGGVGGGTRIVEGTGPSLASHVWPSALGGATSFSHHSGGNVLQADGGPAVVALSSALGSGVSGYSWAMWWSGFSLSPHTALVLSTQADLQFERQQPDAMAQALVELWAVGYGSEQTGHDRLAIDPFSLQGADAAALSQAMGVSFANLGDGDAQGYLSARAFTASATAAPVPEPQTWALWLGAPLALALRRVRSIGRRRRPAHPGARLPGLRGAALALLGAVCLPALAGGSQGAARLDNLQLQVIDMAPADGIAAAVTLDGGLQTSMQRNIHRDNVPFGGNRQLGEVGPPGMAYQWLSETGGSGISGGTTAGDLGAPGQGPSLSMLAWSDDALELPFGTTQMWADFSLTPHTLLVFTADASLQLAASTNSVSAGQIYLATADQSRFASAGTSLAITSLPWDSLADTPLLQATLFNDSDLQLNGSLTSYLYLQVTTSVPESSTTALMLSGLLAMLHRLARRRRA